MGIGVDCGDRGRRNPVYVLAMFTLQLLVEALGVEGVGRGGDAGQDGQGNKC
jgi:hypothetical protein